MKQIILSILVLGFSLNSWAQLPTCQNNPSNIVYIHQGTAIYNYDVTQPLSATNPIVNTITLPSGAGGLAVSNNLNSATPAVTFYTTISGNYWYHDGTTWVNTGHSAGGGGAVNSGGGGNFLYNLIGFSGQVWQYDGTGPATLLLTVPGFSGGGPYDLVGDCDGGFYILRTNTGPFMRKYDSSGNLVSSWPVTGSSGTAGGGFAIANNTVYYRNGGGFRSAPFAPAPAPLNFSVITSTTQLPSDMACCPVCGIVPPSPPPVANFDLLDSVVCAGTCLNFTDLSTGGPTAWQWTFPGGVPLNVALQNPGPICFNTPGSYDLKLVASNGGGADSITRTLTVLPNAIASVSGDSVICAGESATLTAGPNAGGTYVWLNNNASTATITVNPTATTTYTLVAAQGICTDTTTFLVTVNPQPNALISGNNEICFGNAANLSVTPAGAVYTWTHGPSAASITVNPTATTTYNVMVDLNGCIDSTSYTVLVNPLPEVLTTATLTNCNANTGTAEALANLGTPPYSYAWSNGGTGTPQSNLGVGNYMVTVTDSKSCTATSAVDVMMYPNPTASISPYPHEDIAVGENIPLQASGGIIYNWLITDGLNCSNCPNPIASPLNDIVYCVEVTDNNGCSDTACTTIFVDTSCANIFIPNAFTPNGDNRNDFIQVENRCISSLKFVIFNRWGQKVYETRDLNAKWDGTFNGEPQLISTYFYVLEAELINGRTIRKRGDITLLR